MAFLTVSDLPLTMGFPGEGNGTPLQHSCLENPMDGGAWWAAVHGVAKSRTRLSDFPFTFHFPSLEKEMATHSSGSCLENPRDGGAWWGAVYGVAQSRTRLKRLSSSMGFPGGSAGKESTCNAGDLGSSPGSGRFPGEGIGYPLQYSWASLVAQGVNNLPAMRETWVQALGQEDPLE